ncbi:MAG: hypothetical protein Ct9H90mP3_3240 [Flammeovirgaceae bacterium]|nr:MAG: hypothetical protein Ct9H90mP3_3240 [Flammeovirgaceae bacterium]
MFDFGLVGLGVMGRNFILNVASKGFSAIGLSSKDEAINLLKEKERLQSDGRNLMRSLLKN